MSEHPKEAVELVARALWAETAAFTETWEYDAKPVPSYLHQNATALLDQIAPHYREQAAKWHDRQADAAMSSLSSGSNNAEFREAHDMADFHKASAAAIRKGE